MRKMNREFVFFFSFYSIVHSIICGFDSNEKTKRTRYVKVAKVKVKISGESGWVMKNL